MASCQWLHVYLFMLPSTYTLLLNFCNSTRDDVPPLKLDAAQWPQKSPPPFHIVPFNIIQFYDKVTWGSLPPFGLDHGKSPTNQPSPRTIPCAFGRLSPALQLCNAKTYHTYGDTTWYNIKFLFPQGHLYTEDLWFFCSNVIHASHWGLTFKKIASRYESQGNTKKWKPRRHATYFACWKSGPTHSCSWPKIQSLPPLGAVQEAC